MKCDGRANELAASAQTEHKVEGRLLLDVVVGERAAILQLLAGEDETLLIWRDAFLVLDLGLDILDGVTGLDLERDRLARQCLDEDLHATAETEHEVKRRLLLDVVVRQGATIFELFACEDKTLLIWGDSLFVLDLSLHVLDGVARLDLQSDGLPGESLHEDLHDGQVITCL